MNHIAYDPVQRPGYLLWQAAHAQEHILNSAPAEFGLTILQFGCLIHITNEPGISGAELARRTGNTPQSVQTGLKPLLDNGTIERRPHPVHGRVLGVYPGPGAVALAAGSAAAVDSVDDELVDGFSAAEAQLFHDLLLRAVENLNPVTLDRSSLRPQ